MSEETARPPEEMAFGEAMTELEAIVVDLEGGKHDLEDSIARYERGVALLEACRTKLEDAQQRVTTLMGELEADDGSADIADAQAADTE
jgi:exodeoxyribonuclease VII small subunit